MERRKFIQNTALAAGGLAVLNPLSALGGNPLTNFSSNPFPEVRIPPKDRHFSSDIIEKTIHEFNRNVEDKELGWLFNNCFPNTLDSTVTYSEKTGRPDTYVITGDIDAMWLRDSSAQVWPYLPFMKKEKALEKLVAGVINRQTSYILKDSYANAFYDDPQKKGEWFTDITEMQPGVHERKWEIDSLCYPIRLAYEYWKTTGDTSPFDENWKKAMNLILETFSNQQMKEGKGDYSFQRETVAGTDTRVLQGYGYPVKPVGLIASAFRPSDDATVFSFLVPSNFFAVASLRQVAEMMTSIAGDRSTSKKLNDLSNEVEKALQEHAAVKHPNHGDIYAFEIDGYGNHLLMDDANVPSLLSLPYLNAVDPSDQIYRNTRNFILSLDNPFFFKGEAAEGIGGPHIATDTIWHMSIIMQAMTSHDDQEIRKCIHTLKTTHANTGFMHESFHKDDPKQFTRSWFAWANTLFGELLWKTYQEKPHLLG